MQNTLLIGAPGSGKSSEHVKNRVKGYAGKVILINNREETFPEWKNKVRTVSVEELDNLSEFGKIEINLNNLYYPLTNGDVKTLERFVLKHIDDTDTLFVFEESCNTVPFLLPMLLAEQHEAEQLIVAQNLAQIIYCCQKFGSRYHIKDWRKELFAKDRFWFLFFTKNDSIHAKVAGTGVEDIRVSVLAGKKAD